MARWLVRHRWLVLAAWTAAALVLLPASRRVEQTLDVSARIRGSESAAVEDALRTRFDAPFATWAVLVVSGAPTPTDSAGRVFLRALVDSIARVPGVTRTLSYLDTPDTTFLGHGGRGTFIVAGLDPGDRPADQLVPDLRERTAAFQRRLAPAYPHLALSWTGEIALNYDLRRTSAAEGRAAEARALPLTLVLLLWAFGAVVAALLPGIAGLTAIGLTLGITVLLTRAMHLSILLENIVTMLGLGLGIDYALLIVSRFREALAEGRAPADAAAAAARHGGHTIAISGLAVAIGFAALLGIPLNELRSVAVGGMVVAIVSVAVAASLVPALLSWLGPRVNLGRLRRGTTGSASTRWRTWGRLVARHPWRVLLIGATPVVLLAVPAWHLSTTLPRGDWLPPRMESARGVHALRRMGRSAAIQTLSLVLELPAGTPPLTRKAWDGVHALGAWVAHDTNVAAVRSLPSVSGLRHWSALGVALIGADARKAFVSRDRRAVTLSVLPREDADPTNLVGLVDRLRAADVGRITGLPGARLTVGGLPAFNADYEHAIGGRFLGVIALIVTGTLVALFVAFRSVLIPLKAVALNLLSVAAAFGALVLVIQDGHGARWIGLAGAMHGVFPIVPVLVFCTVFGLSIDYEVFLVGRIAEARRRGSSEAEAIAEGLSRTGGVITSAAMIMVVVFAAFALGQFALMKMLGLALATAVALDATLVRLAVGPALLTLAGRWNWWPSRVGG